MDFAWTSEQEQLRASIIEFAENQLDHSVREHDRTSTFSFDSWQKCAQFGILGGNIPEAYGGSERSVLDNVLIMEALGYGCQDNGFTLGLNAQMWTINQPILTFGTEAQKREFLPKLAKGECIAADAITEANAGSDALSMESTACKDGDDYILNGRKQYTGFAPVADLIIVFAKTDPEAGPWGISAFLVDASLKGIQRSENWEKMGLRTLPLGEIVFEDCRIPASCRLGPEGVGMSLFNDTIEWERSFILASHVGAMARQLDMSVEHAKTRRQFGKKIGDFQSVSNRLVDMRVRLENCRLLMYKAAWLKQEGKPASLEANMTNLVVAESFLQSSLEAIRVHGGKGYLTDFGIERDLRDAVGGVIYAGTSDIQRNLIARLLGL